ncbi:hypothetical protein IJ096_00575 [Candidatus Saccharibacteria bacterium]|nr:hypothetical protein [Candidatus Saccharibacteria bacterium]
MIRKHIKQISSAVLAAAFALLAVAVPVHADEVANKGAKIGVSPITEKVSLNPGDKYTGTFKVLNASENDMEFNYNVYATPFQVKDKDYSADFSTEGNYTKLSKWITFSKDSGTLKAGEKEEITYTITVPNDVPAGGQYAAIMAEIANNEESPVQTTSRAALTILAHIAGETRREGSILENNVPSFIFGGNKLTTTSLVNNKGNIDEEATYTVKIFPFGSSEEVYTNEEDPETRNILPESERSNSFIWDETPQLGLYTVEQTINYLGQVSTTSKLVLICPIWLLVIFIALIFAIIFTIVSRIRARKGSNGRSSARDEKRESRED